MVNVPTPPPVPRLAATVMLVRASAAGTEVYLTRRTSRSRFMPDAFVFPGGAVDANDRDDACVLSQALGPGERDERAIADLTLRVAAIRETFEEAGVLLACDAAGAVSPSADALAVLRREAMSGAGFGTLLATRALRPDVGALTYYSNWVTPASEPIRFDAHFFVALAPAGQIARADAVEVHDGMWLAPAAAIAASDRGDLNVRFPTRKHLERLARFDDLHGLFAHARDRAVFAARPVERDALGIDEDAW
ncbi:MAG: NUDIX hydrolase [Vulcanimicrobiaceae bacterium]